MRLSATKSDGFRVYNECLAGLPKSICLSVSGSLRSMSRGGLSEAASSESSLGQAVMDAEVANCSASKHGPGQSVKFLAAREHIDNQLYALGLSL